MRKIDLNIVKDTVRDLCIKANISLPKGLESALATAAENEELPSARGILGDLQENLSAAKELNIPICQDTGMTLVFIELGQEVCFTGGNFEEAINLGVAEGYQKGFLRTSIVADPLRRVNTGDNTPALIYTKIVPGDKLKITVAPKGFGSENKSRLKMLNPSDGKAEIAQFVIETVELAGSSACPPFVIGVGIGGNFEYCAFLAKKALCRPLDQKNSDDFYANFEEELLERVNKLNIGPQGFGGSTTALALAVEQAPTHIAGLPLAVNIGCHATRHASKLI
ncbi:MAG: fumarate hydratase [Clostridiales bacterium]|nr:fumarate hydratase [Clostridiales bacterium]